MRIFSIVLVGMLGCATSSPETRPVPAAGPDRPMTPPEPMRPADPATGCPAIQLRGPDAVSAGAKARFSAVLAGGPARVDYVWTVSVGRIVSGQHTPELVVDTTGLSGATINATLAIGGLATTCATTTANASLLVGTPINE